MFTYKRTLNYLLKALIVILLLEMNKCLPICKALLGINRKQKDVIIHKVWDREQNHLIATVYGGKQRRSSPFKVSKTLCESGTMHQRGK